jgi:hypothetical protein
MNLVANGSFETDLAGWNSYYNGSEDPVRSSAWSNTGLWSMRCNILASHAVNTYRGFGAKGDTFGGIEAGVSYTASLRLNVTDEWLGLPKLLLRFEDAAGASLGDQRANAIAGLGEQTLTVEMIAPPNATQYQLYVYADASPTTAQSGEFYVDSVSLTPPVSAVSGTGSPLLGTVSSTAAGKVEVKGSGGAPLGSVTSTSTGQVAVQGSGTGTLATASLSGTGAIGSVPISGSGTSTLAVLTSTGTAKVEVRGTGSTPFATLTGSGTGGVAVSGLGSSSFATPTTTGSAAVAVAGSGASSLGSVWSVGAGTVGEAATYALLVLTVARDVELALGARPDTGLAVRPRPDIDLALEPT